MRTRAAMDVSGLPEVAYGPGAPIWWGTVALVAVEGMVFAMVAAGYLYLRMGYRDWPPPDAHPDWVPAAANLILLGIVCIPMRMIEREAPHAGCGRILRLLLVCMALTAACLAARAFEIRALNTYWHEHSYGSVVWGIAFLHTFHLLINLGETGMLALHIAKKGLDDHHRVAAAVNSFYWYFIFGSWVLLAALVYFVGPRL